MHAYLSTVYNYWVIEQFADTQDTATHSDRISEARSAVSVAKKLGDCTLTLSKTLREIQGLDEFVKIRDVLQNPISKCVHKLQFQAKSDLQIEERFTRIYG